jgi:hypothetical protein
MICCNISRAFLWHGTRQPQRSVYFHCDENVLMFIPRHARCHLSRATWNQALRERQNAICIGAPITLGRCPSLSEHESESMLRTHLVCSLHRETNKRHVGEARSVLTAAILLPQRLSYWGKIVSLRMLTNQAHRLVSDHCATEIRRPKSAVQPITLYFRVDALVVTISQFK